MSIIRSTFTRLRTRDGGATDPILVIAAIAVSLVLLVGGSFAVAGMNSNGKNLNAQGDLDKVATAETAASSGGGSYLKYSVDATGTVVAADTAQDGDTKNLAQQSIGFTPTTGDVIKVVANGNSWVAGVKSATGTVYWRSSAQSTTYKDTIATGKYDAALTLPSFP